MVYLGGLESALENDTFVKECVARLEVFLTRKAPTVAHEIIPLLTVTDFEYKASINAFSHPSHLRCPKHFSSCISYAAADIVARYRAIKCRASMDNEMTQYMDSFTSASLVVKGAKDRYEAAISTSFWMHIPINAAKVFREELLGRALAKSIPGFEFGLATTHAQSAYRHFILSESPFTEIEAELEGYLVVIGEEEKRIMERTKIALQIITDMEIWYGDLGVEKGGTIIQSWIYTPDFDVECLRRSLMKMAQKRRKAHRMGTLIKLVLSSPLYGSLFSNLHDLAVFAATPQFKLAISASVTAQLYLDGDYVKISEAVCDVVAIVCDLVHNEIDPIVVLVLLPLM